MTSALEPLHTAKECLIVIREFAQNIQGDRSTTVEYRPNTLSKPRPLEIEVDCGYGWK